MTADELRTFAIANAGKEVTGMTRGGESKRGRLIAYSAGKVRSILIESQTSGDNTTIPNPLPNMPYLSGDWYRVVSPCKLGNVVQADTVKLVDSTTPQLQTQAVETTTIQAPQPKSISTCHSECIDGFCHRVYMERPWIR